MAVIRAGYFEGKGRIVVAITAVPADGTLESVPVVPLTAGDRGKVDDTSLFPYYFVRKREREEGDDYPGYVVFGLTSFCSHSDEPNAKVHWREEQDGLWADLVPLRPIANGEEITISYTNIDQYVREGWVG